MINCELGMSLRAVITNYETELGSGSASLHTGTFFAQIVQISTFLGDES